MADITVTTDFSQVNNLKDALNSADSTYVKVVNTVVRENNRLKNLLKMAAKNTADTNKIKEQSDVRYAALLQREADKQEKARARVAANAEKEAKRVEAANQKLIASEVKLRAELEKKTAKSAQNFQAQVGPNLGLGAQGISAGASASAIEGEIERLRTKYDGVYASSQLYEKSLNEINQAHMLGAVSAKQHEAAVESLNLEYQAFQNGTANTFNRFAKGVQQTGAGLNNSGVLIQQLGYQAGDFAVQVQSGTNAFVAFGQQATQLVGFLPMLASELGIAKVAFMGFSLSIAPLMLGLSILVPVLTAIGAYFSRTGESAKEAATEVDEFESKIKSLDNTLKDYLRTKNAESMGITPDELTSVDAMTKATLDLASANAQLAKITNSARERAMLGGPSGGAIALFTGRAEEEAQNATILDLEAKRQDAINRINVLKQRSIDLTTQEALNSQSNYELEYTRLKFGEGSLRYKELEAKLARDAYEQEVRAKGLNVENMMAQYDAQQKVLKGLQDEFDIREVLKEQQREIAEGPQKALNIQLEYQRLLQEGVKPAEAMAEAQYKAEKALIQSKLASQDLTEEQNSALQSQLRVLDATYQMEGQIRASAIQTSLLEQGMSQSAIDALKFAGVDLSSGVSAAAAEAAILAANMNMTLSDAYSFINLVNSQVYGQVGARSNPKDFLPGGSKYTNENFKPFVPLDDTKSDGGGGSEKDVIADFQKQLELERELLGTSEAYQKVRQALGDDFRKTSPEVIAGLVQQATEIERLIELEEQRKSIMDTVKSSLEDGFMSMVDGTKSVKDAFKSMAAEIIKELYRVFVVQQIVNSISGGIGNLFGGGGAVTSSPRPMANPFPRAIGGPVIANQPYIVGERGPELVIPRSSGTVLNHDKTKAAIGGSNDVTVNNNITVTGSDAAMVRVEIAKMIPQITNATKAAVIDAKQRGGQMAAAFR